jgi:hypothetical protein
VKFRSSVPPGSVHDLEAVRQHAEVLQALYEKMLPRAVDALAQAIEDVSRRGAAEPGLEAAYHLARQELLAHGRDPEFPSLAAAMRELNSELQQALEVPPVHPMAEEEAVLLVPELASAWLACVRDALSREGSGAVTLSRQLWPVHGVPEDAERDWRDLLAGYNLHERVALEILVGGVEASVSRLSHRLDLPGVTLMRRPDGVFVARSQA